MFGHYLVPGLRTACFFFFFLPIYGFDISLVYLYVFFGHFTISGTSKLFSLAFDKRLPSLDPSLSNQALSDILGMCKGMIQCKAFQITGKKTTTNNKNIILRYSNLWRLLKTGICIQIIPTAEQPTSHTIP